ncbi:MAG: class I SAM-dependent rRNA methyltransferase [Deltaproteobacteria bacterium]|nr:class I SAM-dependent rRNA methyltransferase [Deltaproteobacteria bacterium]
MSEGIVQISRRAVDRLGQGHLWIYKSDIERLESVSGGEVVKVVDGRGWFVGRAFYSQVSQITLRMLTREDEPVDRDFFARRIEAALQLRRELYPGGVEALRLIHSEGDYLPGLVADRYADVLVVQTLSQGAERQKELFLELLTERVQPRAIVLRNDAKVRSHEGLVLERKVVKGQIAGPVPYRVGTVGMLADPLDGQKTGAFLDQRENHAAVAAYVKPGMDCLDCFTYTGGFALQMARAGGRVIGVDISEPALKEAREAATRNAITAEWVEANCFDWLKERSLEGEAFDLIVLDPPAFAKKKDKLEGAIRGYKEINLRALQLLRPGGILVSCSCSYHLSEQALLDLILSASLDTGRRVQLLEKRGAGRDHPVLLGVPETQYLKTLVFRRVS